MPTGREPAADPTGGEQSAEVARLPARADAEVAWDGDADLTAALAGRVTQYARAARATSTWRAYDTDLRHFRAWCAAQPTVPTAVPASALTVAGYIAALADAGYKPSTIRRRLAAISVAHQLAKAPNPATSPEVATVWDGIRRVHGTRPARKEALETSLLTRVLAAIDEPPADAPTSTGAPADETPKGALAGDAVPGSAAAALAAVRDRALLLVGFAGCLRRSELVGLDVADIEVTADGLVLSIRSSKTDQEGAGALVGVAYGSYRPTCPVRAWQAWAAAARLTGGPAFRGINRHGHVGASRLHPSSVARIVQRRAAAAGLDPADFAGHSLRSGFATAAARAGVADRAIMRQGRWRSASSLDSYVRAGRLFDRDNPSGRVGL
ncbi:MULTISPECIES: tyrosine-type recombinase/integrase [unclassified Pseudofrankia]|uniref:tyrosine-type recombinase/integrase n=1 Tax=unclassified Pseudofrankia TaxID=2994372 RepID=UPI0008DA6F0B|nr:MULTISPECIES: tyrosine-type recombinase/integrase [unclassified Pseudofrankia]MDT3441611.1 tyrosine-type recombinase/integrase [Pseudofrankia sp. BMG5.37]OHV45546.1 integrase [Pseudofrankia sp. BMG5.36]